MIADLFPVARVSQDSSPDSHCPIARVDRHSFEALVWATTAIRLWRDKPVWDTGVSHDARRGAASVQAASPDDSHLGWNAARHRCGARRAARQSADRHRWARPRAVVLFAVR